MKRNLLRLLAFCCWLAALEGFAAGPAYSLVAYTTQPGAIIRSSNTVFITVLGEPAVFTLPAGAGMSMVGGVLSPDSHPLNPPCTNLLANAGFEYPRVPDLYVALPGGGDTTLFPWVTLTSLGSGNDGIEYFHPVTIASGLILPDSVSHGNAAEGLYAVDLAPVSGISGGIYQRFATVPGRHDHVYFKMGTSTDHGRSGDASLLATTWGDMLPQRFFMSKTESELAWEWHGFDFTAASDPTTLVFTTEDDPALGYVNLDDVHVTECPPPFCIDELIPPPDVVVECTNRDGTIATFGAPTIINRCNPTNSGSVACDHVSGSAFPKGETWVTCTWTRPGTDPSLCRFKVTVQDTTAPVFTNCPSDKTVECGDVWDFGPAPDAFDACCPVSITFRASTNELACDYVKNGKQRFIYEGIWTATDCAGNTTNCTQIVIAEDTTPPIFTSCPTNKTVRVDASGRVLPAFSILHNFHGTDGAYPAAGLIQVGDALYGTTALGGSSEMGTVFKLDLSGGPAVPLISFNGSDGALPYAAMIQVGDALYGTTAYGGSSDMGTVFKLNLSGGPVVPVHSFSSSGAAYPYAALIQVGDALYGTTRFGGSWNKGTVFTLSLSGGPAVTLHSFNWDNGAEPDAALLQVGDALYGTTKFGGTIVLGGNVFKLNLSGGPAIPLHTFSGSDGAHPGAALLQVGDALYGTTEVGGSSDGGTVFKLDLSGGPAVPLHNFNGDDGANPVAALLQVGDALYGTTGFGGSSNKGTVFKLDLRTTWDFDAPTAVDACSGTNVTITELPRVTNGTCPQVITRTWYATDCAGNSITGCTQTVRLFGPPPPVVIDHGHRDDFVGPESASPRAELVTYIASIGVTTLRGFDDGCIVNRFFADSFAALPPDIVAASLRIKLRACDDICENDTIGLLFSEPGGVLRPERWSSYIGTGNPGTALFGSTWSPGTEHEFLLDLAELPLADGTTVNFLRTLNELRYLDIDVQDDTQVDFVALEYRLAACPTLFDGLPHTPIGSAIAEVLPDLQTGAPQLVVRNFSNLMYEDIPADGIAVRTDAAQFVRLGFDCLDPGTLADGANLTFRAFGEVNHSNDQVVATFQAADVGNDIEYRARFDSLGDVPLLAVLYDGSNIVGTARLPSGPPFPPIARVTGQAGDARVTPFLPLDGYPATILEFPAARPMITLTGGQPVPGTRLVLTPDVPKLQPPDRPFELLNDVVNDGLNFWWQNPSNYIRNCTVEGPISRLEVLAAFVPEVRILDEQVGQFGMAHQALGDTQFLAGDNPTDLMVLPDAFDNGGIDILAGSDDAWNGNSGATPFNFRQRFLVEGGTNGAFVQTGIIGPMFNTNELVAGIKVTQMASNIFSLDGGQNWQTAEVWRDGALVATTAGSNGVVATATAWPDRAGVNSPFSNPLNGTNNILLTLGWNSNIPLNLTGGGSVTGNELRVGYNDQSFSQETHAFSLRFGGLQSLRLIDETVAPAGLYFQGFAHRPLGSASLDVMSNELVVTIPGTNSGRGVSIALGNAGFADVDFAGFAATDPDGAKIEMRANGTKLGVPGQFLGAICAIKDGTNTLFAVDRSPLGSDSSVLSVFDQARLVWVVSQMPTGMLRASDRFPLRWRINPVDPKSLGASPTIIDFPDRPLLVLPDGNAVRGDRVMISEFDPEHTNRTEVSSVARLDVTGMGLPSFRITGERLGAFHQAHQAVGQARLRGIGDWVRLGNLVSGGANPDGVEFPLIGKDTFTVFWRQLDRFGEVPAGAVLRASVNDSPTGPLRISQVTSLGGQKEISADFSSLGASSRYVEVLRSNVVVFSNSFNGEAGAVARMTAWPAGFKAGRGQNESSNMYTSWAWVSPEDFMIAGQTISGDELRLRAIPTLPNNFAPSSIRVQVAGIPDLHLVYDAASVQAPIKTSIQALPGGTLVIFWDTSNPGQVLQQADDPAAPWQDIPGATASPYLIRPAGEKKFLRVFQK